MVEGVEIGVDELDALSAGDAVDAEERASSLFLLILHRLLTAEAKEDFGYEASATELEAAFAARTQGVSEDIDAMLSERGVTRRRVMLDAELDLIGNVWRPSW